MKIDVVKPFNFARGPVTKHYAKGEHEVTAEVAAHAARHGFLKPEPAVVAGESQTADVAAEGKKK